MPVISKYFIFGLFLFFIAACSSSVRFSNNDNKIDSETHQTGIASYYADKFEGRSTSNGEIYSHQELTAAHRSLPFGTKVKVTNLGNGKSVVVRINDRGPFVDGRIIDLSKSAAEQIDMIRTGTAKVEIEIIK